MRPLRILIVGGGIGGLCLAHGLCGEGIDSVVYDRDPDAASTGGYRLHLSPHGHQALARCLRPELYRTVLASATGFTPRPVAVDTRFRTLLTLPRPRDTGAPDLTDLFIGRVPLRRLLAHDLDDRVHFGRTFAHYQQESDGTVTATFTDGSQDNGDLLVGADGAGSRVAAARLPWPAARPAGVTSVGGRVPLTDQIRALLPAQVRPGPAFVFGPGGRSLFLTVHDLGVGAVLDGTGPSRSPRLWRSPI